MEPTTQPEYRSPASRLGNFLRDFLPEQNLQLLFPLGSFLLLLGASHFWYRIQLPGVWEAARQLHSQVDSDALQQFTRSLTAWVALQEQFARYLVQLAFLASLILWTLPVRKALSRFAVWVFLPVGFALAAFPAYLIATAHRRNAFLDAFVNSLHVAPLKHSWFPGLGEGFYLTIAGLIVFAFGLFLVRGRTISLPLRFRGAAEVNEPSPEEASHDGRNVFIFVIVTVTLAVVISNSIALPQLLGKNPLRSWSGTFPVFEWAIALANAATAACLALVLFPKEKWQMLHRLLRVQPFRSYVLAVAIPLAVVLIPRFLLGGPFQFDRWTPESFELFIPHPLPWVLIVYAIAFFEEFAVRGYLQTTLRRHLDLKRSIFLTALLWGLLPLGFGMTNSLVEAKVYTQILGLPYLVSLATLIVYSVPLGWLYARTRSVLPVALMHGTIALFHVGMGYEIHINRPEFYWMELALWIFIGWYLFKKHPLESAESPREPEVAPA
jgi:membrane protease YdiL (CAAX protease family)